MRIKEIIWQDRRDFRAIMECEHCRTEIINDRGYDDDFYHRNVIPAMKCENCGKRASENYRPLTTKYPADQIV